MKKENVSRETIYYEYENNIKFSYRLLEKDYIEILLNDKHFIYYDLDNYFEENEEFDYNSFISLIDYLFDNCEFLMKIIDEERRFLNENWDN